ncbi:protein PBDC1 [Nephila pilipes]|uniref:Protein PBDC1 n=1 Tax=Nephila pilipes TaxID=299642 RepID=A0A8X6IRQ3_NEPPI|nr:protein PBDC1 [Nephila pilipes]
MDAATAESENSGSVFDAESYENNPEIELAWAEKAVEHMEIHFNLIISVPPEQLRLTPHDDLIYNAFMKEFPDFKLDVIDMDSMKSRESKKKWRSFCEKFRDIVEDSTFGTLVRIDCEKEYSEENSVLVVRIQFLAIEIARNRQGLNEKIRSLKRASN